MSANMEERVGLTGSEKWVSVYPPGPSQGWGLLSMKPVYLPSSCLSLFSSTVHLKICVLLLL